MLHLPCTAICTTSWSLVNYNNYHSGSRQRGASVPQWRCIAHRFLAARHQLLHPTASRGHPTCPIRMQRAVTSCRSAHLCRTPYRHRRSLRTTITMSSGPLFIGVDVGTQSTKALLYEASSREVLGRGSVSYSLTSDRPGQAEQDPSIWIEVSWRRVWHLPTVVFLNRAPPLPPPAAAAHPARLPSCPPMAGLQRLDPRCAG